MLVRFGAELRRREWQPQLFGSDFGKAAHRQPEQAQRAIHQSMASEQPAGNAVNFRRFADRLIQ